MENLKRIWGKSKALLRYISSRHITVYAASACFFMVLSIFPMLVLLLGLLRYTPLEAADLMELIPILEQ